MAIELKSVGIGIWARQIYVPLHLSIICKQIQVLVTQTLQAWKMSQIIC